jgi:hypothetical protein
MDTIRRYSMLIDGDWVATDDRFERADRLTERVDELSGRLDRRAFPLLLSTPGS